MEQLKSLYHTHVIDAATFAQMATELQHQQGAASSSAAFAAEEEMLLDEEGVPFEAERDRSPSATSALSHLGGSPEPEDSRPSGSRNSSPAASDTLPTPTRSPVAEPQPEVAADPGPAYPSVKRGLPAGLKMVVFLD